MPSRYATLLIGLTLGLAVAAPFTAALTDVHHVSVSETAEQVLAPALFVKSGTQPVYASF
ncbi:MAG: hypothetical protein AAFR47_00740 [Pseudomonadota bacterium]